MKKIIIHAAIAVVVFLAMSLTVASWLGAATERAQESVENPVGVASAADESYCTPELRTILKRVLTSCGIIREGGGRGCKPMDAQSVAAMSGPDFNALFTPMVDRAGIIQFDVSSAELDVDAINLIDNIFADRRGASYFLIVARASPEGSVEFNRELSERRATALYNHLKASYRDPDFDQVAGMLWLGKEFAQLEKEFCDWKRSRSGEPCNSKTLNRSAFVAWIDCRL